MKVARYFAGWLLRLVGWWLIEAGYRIDGNEVE